MPHRDDPPTATVADTKKDCPGGVRVWCHNPDCPKANKEAIVTWDRITVPDTRIFRHLVFRCVICNQRRTTFQPLWPRVSGQGPVNHFALGAGNMVEIPLGLPSWEELERERERSEVRPVETEIGTL